MIRHWDWPSPAGRYQQEPSKSKQCLGRASGGKEDLSGKGGSRQVGTMTAVEVSTMGHWQSRGAGRWHRKQRVKRRAWGGWAVKSPMFEDKKPKGEIWYFRAPFGLESMRPYWVIELGTSGYHRNETLDPDGFAWFFYLPFAAPLCSSLVWLWSICGVCFSLFHSTFSLFFYVLNCYSAVLI